MDCNKVRNASYTTYAFRVNIFLELYICLFLCIITVFIIHSIQFFLFCIILYSSASNRFIVSAQVGLKLGGDKTISSHISNRCVDEK